MQRVGAGCQAQAQGGGIQIAHAIKVSAAAFFTLLVMRQVLPMASGLASGFALSSYGIVSGFLEGTAMRQRRRLTEFGRGLMDDTTTRWDPPMRRAGYRVRGWFKRRENSIGT